MTEYGDQFSKIFDNNWVRIFTSEDGEIIVEDGRAYLRLRFGEERDKVVVETLKDEYEARVKLDTTGCNEILLETEGMFIEPSDVDIEDDTIVWSIKPKPKKKHE